MKKIPEKERILLGRRIRALRNAKGWTQQVLGEHADINYKFLGEIERGQQNPSYKILCRIAEALEIELLELFRYEHEILDRKKVEARITETLQSLPDDALRQVLLLLRALYPAH